MSIKHGFNSFTLYDEENLIIDIQNFSEQLKEIFQDIEYLSSKFYFNNEEVIQDYDFDIEDDQQELIETIIPNLKSILKEYYTSQLVFNINKDFESIVQFKWEENLRRFFSHHLYLLINILKENLYTVSDFTEEYKETIYSDLEDSFKAEFFNDYYLDKIEDINESEIQEFQIALVIKRMKLELENFIKQQFSYLDAQMKIIVDLIQKSTVSNENSKVKVETSVYSEELKNYLKVFGNDFSESVLLFSWRNMSSGEIAILNMLSKIKEIRDEVLKREMINEESVVLSNKIRKEKISYRDIVLFVDESDLYLHPQWQKKFLTIFLKATKSILGDTKLHIILTTHSPFIVSDIPKENICLLKKTIENNNYFSEGTFGANINELLANQFFIQGGLVGEFAKIKINEIANKLLEADDDESLENIYINKEYYQSFIDIIA